MKKLRVLLLEDNPLDAELILANLTEGGLACDAIRVQARADFEAALGKEFDLILADYNLPSFDGVTALRLAKERCPEVPFLFVSGALGEELAIETLKSGATDYVLKQRLERLVPSVQRALREAEERAERRRAVKALRDTEERFRLLVEGVKDYAIFMVDPQGQVVSWNEGAGRILGYQTEEILGRQFALFYSPEDLAARLPQQRLAQALAEGRAEAETWLVRQDGSRFYASGVATALRDEAGRHRGFAIILRDLTDRKNLEEALRQRAEDLAEADRRKDEFLAMLSHELRNPLAPIQNALQIMRLRGLADPALEKSRQIVERQVKHMVRLVDDLLDMSRITRGKIELRKEHVPLERVVHQAVETARPLIEKRQHHLSVTLPPEPLWLEADPARVEQVLANLLNNAAKYTDPGGKIWLTAEHQDGHVLVNVRDTGIGIAPEMRRRIFDLFMQADHSLDRSLGGMGIGLTLVRQLVELHGGTIDVESEGPGKGSEFRVRLPLAAARPPEPAPNGKGGPAPERRPPARPLQVMVVDDNKDGADSLAMMLRLWGHEVRLAHDGPAALALAEAQPPDVMLLDIGLPGMDGYQVAERVRRRYGPDEVVLIALTGYGQEEDRRRSQEAGFNTHVVKPVDPEALERLLAEFHDRLPA